MVMFWTKLQVLNFLVYLLMINFLGLFMLILLLYKYQKGLGIMRRLCNILPSEVLLTLYNTLIYPYLSYCNIIWGCAKITVLHKLMVLQKRAICIIYFIYLFI